VTFMIGGVGPWQKFISTHPSAWPWSITTPELGTALLLFRFNGVESPSISTACVCVVLLQCSSMWVLRKKSLRRHGL
jgi:hypothetical protein